MDLVIPTYIPTVIAIVSVLLSVIALIHAHSTRRPILTVENLQREFENDGQIPDFKIQYSVLNTGLSLGHISTTKINFLVLEDKLKLEDSRPKVSDIFPKQELLLCSEFSKTFENQDELNKLGNYKTLPYGHISVIITIKYKWSITPWCYKNYKTTQTFVGNRENEFYLAYTQAT